MATHTVGTNQNTSLTGVTFSPSYVTLLPADLATVALGIKDDLNPTHPVVPGAFCYEGMLYVPRRGRLQILPGDVVAVDNRGWPVLLSADTIASGPWTFT